jgi:hypothetical protein
LFAGSGEGSVNVPSGGGEAIDVATVTEKLDKAKLNGDADENGDEEGEGKIHFVFA